MFGHLSCDAVGAAAGIQPCVKPRRLPMKYVLTLAVVAFGLFGAISCSRKPEPATTAAAVVQSVKIETVAQQSVDESYEAVGTVRAKNSSIVSSKVLGNIV